MTAVTTHRIGMLTAVLLLAAAGVLLVRQQSHTRALEAELAAARAQSTDAAQLQAEVERLRAVEAEGRRLQEENRELPRLRGEVARLRRDFTAATNQLARRPATPTSIPLPAAAPAAETNLVIFTGTAKASLAPGQTLVMGGWPSEAGKRTVALFTPKVSGSNGSITIGGMVVQLPEALLATPGWEAFQAATATAGSGSGVLDSDAAKQFIETLEKTEGVDVLSSPRLATANGVAGTIFVGDENGSGLSTTLLPVLSPDGQGMELSVSNSLRRVAR
jgi:hypothetical protein